MLSRIFGRRDQKTSGAVTLVAGLGNPGPEHAANRHNVGFQVVETFAEQHGMRFDRMEFQGLLARGDANGKVVILVKPMSFMNRSGKVVKPIMSMFGVQIEHLLVVYDDLDLPTGRLRLRPSGGAGGHRGMGDIQAVLGTKAIRRLRFGVGHPGKDGPPVVDYVLSPFPEDEASLLETAILRATEAIEEIASDDFAAVMGRFNAKS